MKSDLQNLQIKPRELKELTGSNSGGSFKITIWGTAWRTLALAMSMFILLAVTQIDFFADLFLLSLIIGPFIAIIVPTIKAKFKQPESLQKLLEETNKFNTVIKAIDVNDQLVAAGNSGMSTEERKKTIDALTLIKEDLVRALKTEKILRDNKDIIALNPDFFINNLSRLNSLETDSKAGEFGKILSDALSVGREVAEEMKKMQTTMN